MSEIRVLGENAVRRLLTMDETLEAVEQTYLQKAGGEAEVFPMVFHEFEAGKADMDIKSGVMKKFGVYGLKLVSWFGENPGKNLPALFGTTLLFDSETGRPTALLDAEYITAMRTGAAGAIGSKFLARKDSESLLMVGTGHQASFQIAAHLIALDNIKSVSVYGPRSFESAEKFAAVLPQKLEEILLKENLPSGERRKEISKKLDINIEAAQDLSPAARQADIIVTATPSTEPIVKKGDVRPGTHFSCVGSDISGKEEIDPQIFAGARVVVDDIAQALAVGETEIPVKTGVIFEKDIVGEIGEIISGKKEGRRSESDVTIFDSTGIALQDLAVSKLALDKDRELKIGQTINL